VRLSLKPPPPEDCDRRVTMESFAASLDHSTMILVSSFLSNAFDNFLPRTALLLMTSRWTLNARDNKSLRLLQPMRSMRLLILEDLADKRAHDTVV
jgi:hypothetical protein